MASIVLMLVACEPNIDEEYLKNTTDVAGVELVATQSTVGGNEITLEMKTPGVTGYWNYFFGKGLTNRITFAYPLTGTFEFKFVGTLGAELFEKTISVTVDVLDHPVDPEWTFLLGEDPFAGKKWVFDGTGGDNGLWWFMSAIGGPENAWSVWWNAGGECCPPSDVSGKMHFYFDAEEGIKYDYYSSPNASPVKASFEMKVGSDGGYGSFKITDGQNVLGGANPNEGGYNPSAVYDLISLSEDELVLYIDNAQWTSGWTWVFKPAE